MNPATRNIPLKWVCKLARELSNDELDLIRRALGGIPLEPDFGEVENLFERVRRGVVSLYVLEGENGIQAATFFELQTRPDGKLNFHSLATVSLAAPHGLAELDFPEMEQVAKSLGCASLSLGTIRPGLVKTLVEKHGCVAAEIIVRKQLV